MEIETIIDHVINIDKAELSKKIKFWESQKFKVKTNGEYFLILERIKVAEAILEIL
jgi:hypothetical protein